MSERLIEPLCTAPRMEVPIDNRLTLVVLCSQMLRELLSMADRLGMGLQELEGEFQTEDGPVTMALRLIEPTRDIGHISRNSSSCSSSDMHGSVGSHRYALRHFASAGPSRFKGLGLGTIPR